MFHPKPQIFLPSIQKQSASYDKNQFSLGKVETVGIVHCAQHPYIIRQWMRIVGGSIVIM